MLLKEYQDKQNSSNLKHLSKDYIVDLGHLIGQGSSSRVYKGYDQIRGQVIAVKLLDKKYMANQQKYEREFVVMQDIAKQENPNILGYYGYFNIPKDGIYMLLEYCPNGTLKQQIHKKIPQIKVLSYLRHIIDGMIFLNEHNIVHRDLKPQNIYLSKFDTIRIGDFGTAREFQLKMTKKAGTCCYMAPEVMKQGDMMVEYDINCDVWSVGVILYEMLMGRSLFKGKKLQNYEAEVQRLKRKQQSIGIDSKIHPKWIQLLISMLIYNPKKRPTFKQLKQKFNESIKQLKQELHQKYGYREYEDEDYDIQLSTSSQNPYKSSIKNINANINTISNNTTSNVNVNNTIGLSSYLVSMRRQRSFEKIQKMRKWLIFQQYRNQFILSIIKVFQMKYMRIFNVIKYMLMFLAVSLYLKKTQKLIKQLNSGIIITPTQTITYNDIKQFHGQIYQQTISKHRTQLQKSFKTYKKALCNQISSQILGKYLERQKQKQILQQQTQFLKIVTETQFENKLFNQQIYVNLYRKIINWKSVYVRMENILGEDFSVGDCKVYWFMRVAVECEEVFPSVKFKEENYVLNKKQQFANASKKEYAKMILQQISNHNDY